MISSNNSGLDLQPQQNLVAHSNQETNQSSGEELQGLWDIYNTDSSSDMQTGNNLSANSGSSVNAVSQNIVSNYINPNEIRNQQQGSGSTSSSFCQEPQQHPGNSQSSIIGQVNSI